MSETSKDDQPIVELLKTILSVLPSILMTDSKSRMRVIIASLAPIIVNYAIKLAGHYKFFMENRAATVKFHDNYTYRSFFETIEYLEPDLIKSSEIDCVRVISKKGTLRYSYMNKIDFKPGLYPEVEFIMTQEHIDKILEGDKKLAAEESFVSLLEELRDKKFTFKGEKGEEKQPQVTIIRGPTKGLAQKFLQFCVQYKHDFFEEPSDGDRSINRVTSDNTLQNYIRVKKTFENCFLAPENKSIQDLLLAWRASKQFIIGNGLPYKKGLLLYGSPGNGKTSIAFALSSLLKMNVYKIDLKIITKERLENYCTSLTNAIVLFDEIDMMLSGSHVDSDGKQLQKDVSADYITTLMSLLDGSYSLHECVIVFTTMNREVLPPALIRPGRIDAEFEFKNCIRSQFDEIYAHFFGEPTPLVSFPDYKFSVSHIINTIILPNLDKKDEVIRLIQEG